MSTMATVHNTLTVVLFSSDNVLFMAIKILSQLTKKLQQGQSCDPETDTDCDDDGAPLVANSIKQQAPEYSRCLKYIRANSSSSVKFDDKYPVTKV